MAYLIGMQGDTPSDIVPEGWLDAIARADADNAAGRLVDGGELKTRVQDAVARMQGRAPTRRAATR